MAPMKNNKSRISAKELFKELFQLIIIEFNGRGFKLSNDQAIKKAENGIDWGIQWLNSFDSNVKISWIFKNRKLGITGQLTRQLCSKI